MVVVAQIHDAAVQKRLALAGHASGPAALVKTLRIFGLAIFACLGMLSHKNVCFQSFANDSVGGLLYGYNQGSFSEVLTMTHFGDRMLYPMT